MIEIIGVMGTAPTGAEAGLGAEDAGGKIHGPENHSGCVRVDTLGGKDAADLGLVAGQVAGRLGDAEAEDKGAAPRPSHDMEAGTGVEVMAAAGASTDGGTLAVAAAGQEVATGANDERLRAHRDLRKVMWPA